jgi:hypothetical protein
MLVALVALLASSVAGLGLRSDLARKLQISAELGLDVNAVVGNGTSFRTMVASFTDGEAPAEYVSVGIWILLQRSMIVMQANALPMLQIPIDHGNPSLGTYENRYWVNDAYYSPGGPVILYDVGEANGEYGAPHLTSSTSFFRSLLQDFNAIGIVWEHRLVHRTRQVEMS